MSADAPASLQLFSSPGSGRASPAPRATRNAAEDALYKKDKGFRRHATGVERALGLWDAGQQEWADYISFLGRLLKALQAHPPDIAVVPHSDTVALRLSQCLNPALPSGVHQKALEVYAYIFATIGKDALARDLAIYLPGLASVPAFASLAVRPLFLSIFELHVLRLDAVALRPALKAVILALLPGLEDETSEDFERMFAALDKLRRVVEAHENELSSGGSSHFWQCFFLAAITNASRRQGALAFLVRRLPIFALSTRPSSDQAASSDPSHNLVPEAEAAISPEPGLLIRCFASGLADPQLLIQRGFLDLLVTHLPLDSPVLQHRVDTEDLERLVTAAAGVVLRRDMSLNRRLWAWFLGPEPSVSETSEQVESPTHTKHVDASDAATQHAAFFSRYGLEALTSSILKMINRSSLSSLERARPFRVCLSLMDRWEVGGLIVPDIFLPALQSVQSYCEVASREQADEVMKSANAFFDGVDSGLIWGKLIFMVSTALDTSKTSKEEALQRVKLARFVLARFNLKEEDMLLHHMPLMILSNLASLNAACGHNRESFPDLEVIEIAFEITDSLIQIIPDRSLRNEDASSVQLSEAVAVSRDTVFQQLRAFYEDSQGSLDATDPPFTSTQLGQFVLREAVRSFTACVQFESCNFALDVSARVLANLICKIQHLKALDDHDLFSVFQLDLLQPKNRDREPSFCQLNAATIVLTALQMSCPSIPYIPLSQAPDLIHPLVAYLWDHLAPARPKYHVEATRCLLQLHAISPTSRGVEAALASVIETQLATASPRADRDDCSRHFAILWTHVMHELNTQTEKRGNIVRRPSGHHKPAPSLVFADYHAILTRPLLLLLDMLGNEGSETATFMSAWLQQLPSLARVFEVLTQRIQMLPSTTNHDSSASSVLTLARPRVQSQRRESNECLYYLRHIYVILSRPSELTWTTLAEAPVVPADEASNRISLQNWILRGCLSNMTASTDDRDSAENSQLSELHRLSVSIISQIYRSPFTAPLRELEVEVPLLARLETAGPSLQSLVLDAALLALRLRLTPPREETSMELKVPNQSSQRSRLSFAMGRESEDHQPPHVVPPPQLIDCLKEGFSSPASRMVLDDWVHFLVEVLPLFADTIFQNLLPLVECLCEQINLCFNQLKATFEGSEGTIDMSPESSLISLINGLEQILAKAHDRLTIQETKVSATKSPEQPQGFFSHVVSGVFTSEQAQTRTPTANSRLTVLLCFQDTVRICFAIWSWGGNVHKDSKQDQSSSASFGFTSVRMRNRARRILEHLFAAEALECLETLAVLWSKAASEDDQGEAIMSLLNVLNGSKPKHTIPAIFNAVYSRTDPSALDPNRTSTLTSELSDAELVAFLVEYTKSLEDDAMDEIWPDCTLFLRDVLANPLPHRQILPMLLEFTAVIGQKVDNTNFGEQRRMRKELSDIFTRVLTAIFTTRSMGYTHAVDQETAKENSSAMTNGLNAQQRASDVVAILVSIVPKLSLVLVDNDRVAKVVSDMSTSIIGPTFRAKIFPENVSKNLLDLLQCLMKVAQSNKLLRKDISDAFNDPKFFNASLSLIRESWLPILAQWTQSDKERVPELLARISAPTTAGIMFGVGAASARQEADRKTQLNLRRIALLVLASPEDAFTPTIPQLLEKIVELFGATNASSPSSATRADVILVLRAIILRTSHVHLASVWPIINGELTLSLSSLLPDANNQANYHNAGIIQACKLLDELVVLDPDDFQLSEWLFISDTIDAVYKPSTAPGMLSLTDEVNEILSHSVSAPAAIPPHLASVSDECKRTLFLDPLIKALEQEEHAAVLDMTRSELLARVVQPFLGNIAMTAFEARYGGGEVDWAGVWASVVSDAVG